MILSDKRVVCLLVICMAATAPGEQPATPPSNEPRIKARKAETVTKFHIAVGTNEEPVRRAMILLENNAGKVGTGGLTDEQGDALVRGVEPGPYRITVIADHQVLFDQTVDVKPNVPQLDISLGSRTVSGSVIAKGGRPAANVRVSLKKSDDSRILLSSTTDKDGSFKFARVPAGDFDLYVTSLEPHVYARANITVGQVDVTDLKLDGNK